MEKFIGREKEIERLLNCYRSNRSEFVILYGRRRIGKTFLVNHTFKESNPCMILSLAESELALGLTPNQQDTAIVAPFQKHA